MSDLFEFTGIVREFNEYGDRVTGETPASVLAGTRDEAIEKARLVFGARFDSFRKFWSHRFVIASVREIQQVHDTTSNKENN